MGTRCRNGRRWPYLLGPACAVFLLLSACTPASYRGTEPLVLSEAGRNMMDQATQGALESNKDGESSNWSLEGTSLIGTATPMRTYQDVEGAPCRDYQQTVTLDGRTQAAYGSACRTTEGTWLTSRYSGLVDVGPEGPRRTYPAPYYGYGPLYRHGFFYGHRSYGHYLYRHGYYRPHFGLHLGY